MMLLSQCALYLDSNFLITITIIITNETLIIS